MLASTLKWLFGSFIVHQIPSSSHSTVCSSFRTYLDKATQQPILSCIFLFWCLLSHAKAVLLVHWCSCNCPRCISIVIVTVCVLKHLDGFSLCSYSLLIINLMHQYSNTALMHLTASLQTIPNLFSAKKQILQKINNLLTAVTLIRLKLWFHFGSRDPAPGSCKNTVKSGPPNIRSIRYGLVRSASVLVCLHVILASASVICSGHFESMYC